MVTVRSFTGFTNALEICSLHSAFRVSTPVFGRGDAGVLVSPLLSHSTLRRSVRR